MKKKRLPAYLSIALVLAAAVGVFSIYSSSENAQERLTHNPDLPAFAEVNARTQAAYIYALENQEVLEKIPCYCGCYVPAPMHDGFEHKNNKNCFVKDDGSWVRHGSECDVCVNIALDVRDGLSQGLSIKQVRDKIDYKYGRFGAVPTNTPPLDENGNFIQSV